jgi:hypothetical protein
VGRPSSDLNLSAGEVIEVRSKEEILATLDESSRLDAMPFMPEMLQFCGQRFRVYRRADKTCDNIKDWSLRRVRNAVHLTGVRCDGAAHGNCEAGCMIFWKEAWLKRIEPKSLHSIETRADDSLPNNANTGSSNTESPHSDDIVWRASRDTSNSTDGADEVYSCQATDLRLFTSDLPWWDFRQYIRDVRSGNLSGGVADSKSERVLQIILGSLDVVRALVISVFNRVQGWRHSAQYPQIDGTLDATPKVELALQPGEVVLVKSKEEILSTLDRRNRNRGLLFDSEMLRYCGGMYRVLKRVTRIVDEKTGKMMSMKYPCIILEGVICASEYHKFCPRAIYSYWREAWLQRVE